MLCCVPGCPSTSVRAGQKSSEGSSSVSFFTLPRDPKLLRAFLVRIKRDVGRNFEITRWTRICSNHYTRDDYYCYAAGRRELKPGVLPSIFSWSPVVKSRRTLKKIVQVSRSQNGENKEQNTKMSEENSASKSSGICQIIGTGHSDCLSEALNDWWTKEFFTNVIFFCKDSLNPNPVRANSSILAAASPLLAKLLADFPSLADDTVIMLPDYSRAALSSVLQYIYTGRLVVNGKGELMKEICSLTKEFGIEVETKSQTLPETGLIRVNVRFDEEKTKDKGGRIDCQETDPKNTILSIKFPEKAEISKIRENETLASETSCSLSSRSSNFSLEQCFAVKSNQQSNVAIGNFEPVTVFEYDPSPVNLRQVPARQYKRKNAVDDSANERKRSKTLTEEKGHTVSDLGPVVSVSEGSVFSDTTEHSEEDCVKTGVLTAENEKCVTTEPCTVLHHEDSDFAGISKCREETDLLNC